jgi:hypothetical protein
MNEIATVQEMFSNQIPQMPTSADKAFRHPNRTIPIRRVTCTLSRRSRHKDGVSACSSQSTQQQLDEVQTLAGEQDCRICFDGLIVKKGAGGIIAPQIVPFGGE